MSKIDINEISTTDNIPLEEDIADTRNLGTQIGNFITSSFNRLVGSDFDAAFTALQNCNNLFNERIALAERTMQSIFNSTNLLLDFMDGYEILDDSKIGVFQTAISETETQIQALKGQLYTYEKMNADPDSILYSWVYHPEVQSAIASLETSLAELKKELDKLIQLQEIDRKACEIFESMDGELQSYRQEIDGIVVQSMVI